MCYVANCEHYEIHYEFHKCFQTFPQITQKMYEQMKINVDDQDLEERSW